MKITAFQLAQLLQGSIEGDPQATVSRPARIEEAQNGDLSFLDNPKYEHFAYTTNASILLVSNAFQPTQPLNTTLVRVADVRSSLAFLLEQFGAQTNRSTGVISEKSDVHPEASIGSGVSIGAFAVVEAGAVIGDNCTIHPQVFIGKNAKIGAGTVIHPGVRIYHDCVVGDRCILHGNAVIGADGFGFAPQADRTWKKVPQVGNVVIENDVEIGANTCIDRAALGSTIVRSGVKLDNLVHLAHNTEVGKNTAIAAQVGVAGSTKIGENCLIGGQAGFAGHISIADGTQIQAQSGIGSNIKKPGTALFGSPAFDYGEFVRAHIVFKQLPDLQRTVRDLAKRLKMIENTENDPKQ